MFFTKFWFYFVNQKRITIGTNTFVEMFTRELVTMQKGSFQVRGISASITRMPTCLHAHTCIQASGRKCYCCAPSVSIYVLVYMYSQK